MEDATGPRLSLISDRGRWRWQELAIAIVSRGSQRVVFARGEMVASAPVGVGNSRVHLVARAQRSTGGRKVGAEEYRWLEAAMEAVCAGKFNRDWVNAISGGALALANSISAVPFAPVIDSEIYTVDSSLELAQSFVHNTMVALSYPRESCDAGACWWDVFQFQRDFVKYSHTVGGNTGAELRTFADEQFREMLDYAGTLYLNEITAVEVKDAALLYALPHGAPYFTNLRKRMWMSLSRSARSRRPSLSPSAPLPRPLCPAHHRTFREACRYPERWRERWRRRLGQGRRLRRRRQGGRPGARLRHPPHHLAYSDTPHVRHHDRV